MSSQTYSFFKSVEKSFDKASKFTTWENGLLEQIKACNSVYSCLLYTSDAADE